MVHYKKETIDVEATQIHQRNNALSILAIKYMQRLVIVLQTTVEAKYIRKIH